MACCAESPLARYQCCRDAKVEQKYLQAIFDKMGNSFSYFSCKRNGFWSELSIQRYLFKTFPKANTRFQLVQPSILHAQRSELKRFNTCVYTWQLNAHAVLNTHLQLLFSSAQSFYGPCLWSVAHSLVVFPGMCHSSTRPGTSLHVISFTRPSPMLVLQATNAEVRRPGYEASEWQPWRIGTVKLFLFVWYGHHCVPTLSNQT